MEVFPSSADYPNNTARRQYWDEVIDRIRAVPGGVSVANNHIPPFGGRNYNPGPRVEAFIGPPPILYPSSLDVAAHRRASR